MIKYEFNKKDFKKYLKLRRRKTNVIFAIIGSFIYFYITFYLIFFSPIEVIVFYIVYLIILLFIILIFNELYCFINMRKNKILGNYIVNIKDKQIVVNINDVTYEYKNKDIKKIMNKNKYILIKYNNHLSLVFMKDILNKKDCNMILKSIEE